MLEDAILELDCRSHRVYSALKFGKETIARVLDDAATVRGDRRQDNVRQRHGYAGMGRPLIDMHQARIADHVGYKYRSQTSLNPIAGVDLRPPTPRM